MAPLFPKLPDDALFLSMTDSEDPLASYSPYPFELDGMEWPSVEHYAQAMAFDSPAMMAKIRDTPHPDLARKAARRAFWKKRRDWKKRRRVVMTRGVYIKCRTHPEAARALLDTGDRHIVENSLYDHFWGCGRDQRGDNHYGRVLMDVRDKLRQEADPER